MEDKDIVDWVNEKVQFFELALISEESKIDDKAAVTLGNFSCNLSRNFVAPLRHKLHGSLPSVTCPVMNMPRNVFVAVTVARSRTDFYFSQRSRQQKNCKTCSFQGMLH